MKFKNYLLFENMESSRIPDIIMKDCKLFIDELKKTRKDDFIYRGTKKGVFNLKKIKPRKNRKPMDMPEVLHNLFDNLFYKEFKWKSRSEGVFVASDPSILGPYGTPYLFFPIGKYKYVWSPSIEDLFCEIENSDYLHDYEDTFLFGEYRHEYDEIYGHGGEGTFEYDGIDLETNNEDEAIETAIERLGDEELFRDYYLEWIPDMTLDEYLEKEGEKYKERQYEFVSNLVDKYIDKNLKDAIGNKNEMSFKCDSYYLVNRKYLDILKEKIFG